MHRARSMCAPAPCDGRLLTRSAFNAPFTWPQRDEICQFLYLCGPYPGGEIGRRAVFRRLCLRACWFESSSGYNNLTLRVGFFCARDWATIHVKGLFDPGLHVFLFYGSRRTSPARVDAPQGPRESPRPACGHRRSMQRGIAGPSVACRPRIGHQPGVRFCALAFGNPNRAQRHEGRGTEALPWLMEASAPPDCRPSPRWPPQSMWSRC